MEVPLLEFMSGASLWKVYGDEKYAGYLMENNRLLLEYLVFPGGVTLATPELTDEVDEDLPIWRD